jgi:putative membrane protein
MKKMLAILLLAGCASVAIAQDASEMLASQEQDKKFLKQAAAGGYAEVQLGQLAVDKATNPDVKAFGQKMVDDHGALNVKMTPFIQQAGLTPPTALDKKDQELYNQLKGLSGDAFDKAYVKAMLADHKKDVGDFKAEIGQTNNPDLKGTVKNGEMVIEGHYKMVQRLASQVGVTGSSNAGGR